MDKVTRRLIPREHEQSPQARNHFKGNQRSLPLVQQLIHHFPAFYPSCHKMPPRRRDTLHSLPLRENSSRHSDPQHGWERAEHPKQLCVQETRVPKIWRRIVCGTKTGLPICRKRPRPNRIAEQGLEQNWAERLLRRTARRGEQHHVRRVGCRDDAGGKRLQRAVDPRLPGLTARKSPLDQRPTISLEGLPLYTAGTRTRIHVPPRNN
mmetsp:Transcript_6507/g.16033  ORF Transcript_6507/g.16033 Transcript_6507/m.16033 type:complete len:208 (+) Transcript_6507:442-1065(+)